MKINKLISSSEEETIKIGEKIISDLPRDFKLIIIKGKLGVGKTCLVKGMAKKLGIKEMITSPTYGYKNSYNKLIHYDLFLTKKMRSKDLLSMISEDIENNLVVVEWGEKLPKIKKSLQIKIKSINENGRIIKLKFI